MKFIPVCALSDVPEGGMIEVKWDNLGATVLNNGGVVFAIQSKCPHMGADLCKGSLNGTTLTCPKHKASFDVTTGEPIDKAKVLFMKLPVKKAKIYPVKIEDGQVFIGV